MNRIAVLWPNQLQNPKKVLMQGIHVYENIGARNVPALADELRDGGYQAVICTGGVEEAVRSMTQLPMHVVTSGYIDLLESFQRLETAYGLVNRRVALLLHRNNLLQLSRLKPFIRNEIDPFTFADQCEAGAVCRRIAALGYDALITGPTGMAVAGELALPVPAYPLIYSEESILDAVERINQVLDMSRREIVKAKRVQAAIDAAPYAIVATDEAGRVNLCNAPAAAAADSADILGRPVTEVFGDPSWSRVYQEGLAQPEALVRLRGVDYVSSRAPIFQKEQVVGSVGTLQKVEQIRTMERSSRSLQARGLTAGYRFQDILCVSPQMRSVVSQAQVYAQTNFTVLVEGETGTGKEMIAQSIHNAGERRDGPFVAVNCAAVAESLLESELMGYEEGAFTGAKKGGKAGLIELAHHGTLFLDEINQMPPALQSKLLRVLQEHSILRVGGARMIPIDVRIIAASNEPLGEKVRCGQFRSDLYYRINILHLQLPPLRERREDIPPLIRRFAQMLGEPSCNAERLYERVKAYPWPGNIRELENFVCRSVVLTSRGVEPDARFWAEYLPDSSGAADAESLRIPLGTMAQMEREVIAQVCKRVGGNQSQAAKMLGIARNTVNHKLNGQK